MKKSLLAAVVGSILLGGLAFAQSADDRAFQLYDEPGLVDPTMGLSFSMDMAGPGGEFQFRIPNDLNVEVHKVKLLLSRDGSVAKSEVLSFDLDARKADNAEIRSMVRTPTLVQVSFASKLDFIRQQAGLLSVTYDFNGQPREVVNPLMVERRGKWTK